MKAYVISRNFDHYYEASMDDVLGLLYAGKARIVSFSDRMMSISHRQRNDLTPEFRAMLEGWGTLRLPHAVVLKSHESSKHKPVKCPTRRNLLVRDNGICQYDGCQETEDLTIDHVYPQQRFKRGEFKHLPFEVRSWENLVMACKRCNNRKGDRTPDEAGMHLKRPPTAPVSYTDPTMWAKIFPEGKEF